MTDVGAPVQTQVDQRYTHGLCLAVAVGIATFCGALLVRAEENTSLDLSQALTLVRAQTPLTTEAESGVAAAEGRVQQAGVRPNPEASVQVEGFAGSGPFRGTNQAETTVALSQRIELGGKRRARLDAAHAEVDVAGLRLVIQRADLEFMARDRFSEACAAKERVALAESAVERARALSGVADVLVASGRDPPLRASRARAALNERAADLIVALADYASSRLALAAVWGAATPPTEVVGPWEFPLGPNESAPDPTRSLDLALAEAESHAAEAIVRRERSLATTDVTAQTGVRRTDTGDVAIVAGVSIPIPLFDQNRGSVAAALADASATYARRQQALIEVTRRTRDAQATLVAAQVRLETLRDRTVPQAAEALRLAHLGYEAGRFPLLDVLDAEAMFAEVKTSLVEARLAHAKASAVLTRAAVH